MTKIAWADQTLNFYTWNCHKVSEGCKNCYMMTLAKRHGQDPVGIPRWRDNAMAEYRRLKPGEVVFINSMSDTYHPAVPPDRIQNIHTLVAQKPLVTFLLLTKRPERALELAPQLKWPTNLFLGVSVEMGKYLSRIDTLLQIPAAGYFASVEPLLEPLPGLYPYLDKLNWVILGGESGAGHRAFDKQWARQIRDMCIKHNVPFLFKQGSAFSPGQDRILDGRVWDESPFALPVAQHDTKQLSLFD